MNQNIANPTVGQMHGGAETLRFDVKQIRKLVISKLLSIFTFSAIVACAGFFVIHSYIASFSGLFTYSISPTQYMIAGINLLLAIIYYLVLPPVTLGFAIAVVISLIASIWLISVDRSVKLRDLWTRLRDWWLPKYHRLRPMLRVVWTLYQTAIWIFFATLLISLSFAYGTYYYSQSPRMFGGGMPSRVVLVFRTPQPDTTLYPTDPINPIQSMPVLLLMELTDGIMIRDTQNDRVLILKNDLLEAIIDAGTPIISVHPTQSLITPTPFAVITSTP